jgi:hypothetical protein
MAHDVITKARNQKGNLLCKLCMYLRVTECVGMKKACHKTKLFAKWKELFIKFLRITQSYRVTLFFKPHLP